MPKPHPMQPEHNLLMELVMSQCSHSSDMPLLLADIFFKLFCKFVILKMSKRTTDTPYG